MNTLPKFTVYDNEQTADGVFNWGRSRGKIFEQYYDASDQYFMGEVEEAWEMVQKIIKQDPHFIDAYNLLATIEMESGNYKESIKHQQKALSIGEQIIPKNFEGRIRWGFTENRPFLRAIHAVALNHAYDNDFKESTELLEKILAYNPDDNQGIRYLIGDFYFLQNRFKKAEEIYRKNLNYPPYLYSYGLLHMAMGNQIKAVTLFRKGILENIYISDYVRMKVPLIPYEVHHASNLEMPETAYSYFDFMMPKWINFPEAIDLLQYLHLADRSHTEIQQTYMLKHELYFDNATFEDEESQNVRKEIRHEIEKIKQGITQKSSKKILKEWKEDSSGAAFRNIN